jgi:hypothetical protein
MGNDARTTQPMPSTQSEPARRSETPSRRGVLVGGALGVVAAGVGISVAVATKPEPARDDVTAPSHLLAALAAEHALLASIDAIVHPSAALRPMLRQLRADHAAHRAALHAAIARTGSLAELTPSSSRRPAPPSKAELRAAEQHAAARSARLALLLHGSDAVLLASIAACEATHAELLS